MSYNSLKIFVSFFLFFYTLFISCKKETYPSYQFDNRTKSTNGFLFEIIDSAIYHINSKDVLKSSINGKLIGLISYPFLNNKDQKRIINKENKTLIINILNGRGYNNSSNLININSNYYESPVSFIDFSITHDSFAYTLKKYSLDYGNNNFNNEYRISFTEIKNENSYKRFENNSLFEHKSPIFNYAFFQNNKIIAIANKNTLQLISANKDEGFKFVNFPLDFELNLFSSNITTKDNLIILSSNNQTRIFELINNNLVLKSVIN